MASRASKNTTDQAVGNPLIAPEGVLQEHFRIPTGLAVRIADAAHERRCSRRALWVAAMEAYLAAGYAAKTNPLKDPAWCYLCDRPKNDCACAELTEAGKVANLPTGKAGM